jgi:cytochrome c biogenesis protein CcmG, thiol:disulfide interchange protein DsbE
MSQSEAPARLRGTRPRGTRWVRWTALAVAATAVVIAGIVGSRLGTDPTLVASPLLGKPAPAERLAYLERPGTLSLADLRGRVVVVNFWASWCVACREEHPALLAAAAAYRDQGVRFLGVDYQDQRGQAIRFLDEMGRGQDDDHDYVVDRDSNAALDFGVFGVPETFFIDRGGIVVAKITGKSNLPLLAATLDQILAGETPQSRQTGVVQRGRG